MVHKKNENYHKTLLGNKLVFPPQAHTSKQPHILLPISYPPPISISAEHVRIGGNFSTPIHYHGLLIVKRSHLCIYLI
jgi:hypothetical protein